MRPGDKAWWVKDATYHAVTIKSITARVTLNGRVRVVPYEQLRPIKPQGDPHQDHSE